MVCMSGVGGGVAGKACGWSFVETISKISHNLFKIFYEIFYKVIICSTSLTFESIPVQDGHHRHFVATSHSKQQDIVARKNS